MIKWIQILYYKIKSKLYKDTTILAVDIANKSTMAFKNGNIIKTLPINNDVVRGKRSKYIKFYNDFDFNEDEFRKAIKNLFIIK